MPKKRTCIFNCTGYHRLYRFPKGEDQLEKKKEWFDAIGLDINSPHPKWLFICDKHFTSDMIGRRHLTFDAVPTLNLKPSQNEKPSVKCRTPLYYPAIASKSSLQNNAAPSNPVPTNSVSNKLAPDGSVAAKTRFIYVLQPVKNGNKAKAAPTNTFSVPAEVGAAGAANKATSVSATKVAQENTETKVGGVVKIFTLPLAASKRPYIDTSSAVAPVPKKLLTVPRNFNNNHQSGTAPLKTLPHVSQKPEAHTSAPQNQPLSKIAVCSLQTEPKTFIISQPSQANPCSSNSKPVTIPFPPKTTTTNSQSIVTSNPAEPGEPAVKLQSKSKLTAMDNRLASVALKPDAPKKLFNVLRTPTNEATSGELKTILVPSKETSKPQKFVIKRLEVKPVAVTAVSTDLRSVVTGSITHNGSIKSAAANNNPTISKTTPVKSVTNNNTLVNASKKTLLYDVGQEEKPTLVSVTTGIPAAISIAMQSNPTENSTLILPPSTSITLRPAPTQVPLPSKPVVPISEPIINHILEPLGTLRRPLAIFAPESKGYRVDVPVIESAVNPLEINERTAALAKHVLGNYEKIQQANNEEEVHMDISSGEELCISEIDEGKFRKRRESPAEKPQVMIDKCVETQPEPDISELQKEILELKEKLYSKENEITTLRSTMLALAER